MSTPIDDNQDDPGTTPPPPPPPPPAAAAPDEAPPRVVLGADGATTAPAGLPSRPLWQRIPKKFLVAAIILALVVGFGWWSGRGKTDAVDLKAGDCFAQPGLSNITDVTDQSCDGVHETEIYAVVTLGADDAYPGDAGFSAEPSAADLACAAAADTLDVNVDNIPADIQQGYFFADRSEWDAGDRDLLCYASSVSGIPGPLVNR